MAQRDSLRGESHEDGGFEDVHAGVFFREPRTGFSIRSLLKNRARPRTRIVMWLEERLRRDTTGVRPVSAVAMASSGPRGLWRVWQ